MADKYRIRHNDQIIKLQLDDKMDQMSEELKDNIDKSYFSIITSIFNYINDYLLNLGKPSFKNRQAAYKVDSEEYNQNNIEIVNDIKNAFAETNQLSKLIKNNFNYSVLFNQFLKKQVNQLEDKTKNLAIYIDNPHKDIITINEDFRDISNIDIANTTATVRNELGHVTLGIENYKNQMITASEGTKVEILSSSNGYKGNFHQVITKGNSENIFIERDVNPGPKDKRSWAGSNIQYIWEQQGNLRMSESVILDNNPDTWFEYELCNVPDSEKAKTCHNEYENFSCDGTGWNWHYEKDDGGKEIWARDPEDGVLHLDLRIILPEPRYANCIDINSFIIPYDNYNQSYEDFEVKEIKIAPHENAERITVYHRDIKTEKILGQTPDYENAGKNLNSSSRIFHFRPCEVQVIEVYLEQPNAYDCWIGHEYGWIDAKYKIKTKMLIFNLKTDYVETHNRIPIQGINRDKIEKEIDLGVSLKDMIAGGLLGAGIGLGVSFLASVAWNPALFIAAVLGMIFTKKEIETVYEQITGPWLEAFKGWRYAIGIRDINLNAYTYNSDAIVVTKNYEIPKPIKRIEIDTVEDIPNIFYSNQSSSTHYKNRNRWIQHYFSIDDGTTWYPITGNKNDPEIPSIYYINTDPYDVKHSGKVGYVETDEEAYKIKFKSILSRPTDLEDAQYFTPILDNITAKIEVVSTEEEV